MGRRFSWTGSASRAALTTRLHGLERLESRAMLATVVDSGVYPVQEQAWSLGCPAAEVTGPRHAGSVEYSMESHFGSKRAAMIDLGPIAVGASQPIRTLDGNQAAEPNEPTCDNGSDPDEPFSDAPKASLNPGDQGGSQSEDAAQPPEDEAAVDWGVPQSERSPSEVAPGWLLAPLASDSSLTTPAIERQPPLTSPPRQPISPGEFHYFVAGNVGGDGQKPPHGPDALEIHAAHDTFMDLALLPLSSDLAVGDDDPNPVHKVASSANAQPSSAVVEVYAEAVASVASVPCELSDVQPGDTMLCMDPTLQGRQAAVDPTAIPSEICPDDSVVLDISGRESTPNARLPDRGDTPAMGWHVFALTSLMISASWAPLRSLPKFERRHWIERLRSGWIRLRGGRLR